MRSQKHCVEWMGLIAMVGWGLACSKSGSTSGPASGGSGGPTSGSGGSTTGGKPDPGLPTVPGTPDTSVVTALPAVPRMVNVVATAIGDGVNISFDPIDGAGEYRVYVLPDDKDVAPGMNGHVSVRN